MWVVVLWQDIQSWHSNWQFRCLNGPARQGYSLDGAVPLTAQCVRYAESVVARAPDSEDAPSEGDYIVCFFSRNDGSAAVGIVCFCESNYTCVCFFVLLVLRWSLREVGCAFQRME